MIKILTLKALKIKFLMQDLMAKLKILYIYIYDFLLK